MLCEFKFYICYLHLICYNTICNCVCIAGGYARGEPELARQWQTVLKSDKLGAAQPVEEWRSPGETDGRGQYYSFFCNHSFHFAHVSYTVQWLTQSSPLPLSPEFSP